jgi:iron complex outermembrane receptor protein
MTYFTYSKGINPGTFNAALSTLPPPSIAELQAAGLNPQVAVDPERLTNYEIGLKGRFLDNRATLSVDVYYDKWTNQLNPISYVFPTNDPANPINVPGSVNFSATAKSPWPTAFVNNNAATEPRGVELEGELIPVEHVTLNVAAAYNSTKYTNFTCTACSPYPVTFNASGNYLPFAPLFSATAGVQYGRKSNVFGIASDWFVRADYVYRDGVNLQASNTVKTPNTNLFNLHAGVTRGPFGIDAYVNNVFNNKSYTTAWNAFNFTNFIQTSAMVGLQPLRTAGVNLKYKF